MILGSNSYNLLDEPLRLYLSTQPNISFTTALKIVLRYYITPELDVQLTDFKDSNFHLFQQVFGKLHKLRRYS